MRRSNPGRELHSNSSTFPPVPAETAGDFTSLPAVRDGTNLVEMDGRGAAMQRLEVQEQSVRAVGDLSIGVAHDLQNLLSALAWRLAALEFTHAMSVADAAHMEVVHRILASGQTLVAKLQAAAHPTAPASTAVDLEAIIASAIEILQSFLKPSGAAQGSIAIRTALPPLPKVWGAADDLQNVFVNLLLNARDAMPNGGSITIGGEVLPDGVIVRVDDEGTGIPPAQMDKIFEPFFTTKRHKGMGIGLALAREAMHQAGGQITARNRGEGGASFELRFPLARPRSISCESNELGQGPEGDERIG
jgi:two-component system cell cycle sensor histidine kinase/response regulator CckA